MCILTNKEHFGLAKCKALPLKKIDISKKRTIWDWNLHLEAYEAHVLLPQHIGTIHVTKGYVVYITDCVWAADYRNSAEDSVRNRLHPGTQSNVNGERQ